MKNVLLLFAYSRIWFYWGCNPLSYAQKGMAVNEFRAPRWQGIFTNDTNTETVGDAVLAQRGLPRNGYNRVLGFGAVVRYFSPTDHSCLNSFCNGMALPSKKPNLSLVTGLCCNCLSKACEPHDGESR